MTNIFNNSYNNYNNPQQQRQNFSANQTQDILKQIYAFQNQPQLGMLIQSLQNTQAMYNKELEQAIQAKYSPVDPNECIEIQNRCKKIKAKNQKILLQIMNIRQKIIRLTSRNSNTQIIPTFQAQNRKIQQKNLKLKRQIQQKIMYLKQRGMQKKMNLQSGYNKSQYKPVFTVLKELKQGAVCLQKQVHKQKIDMELTIKHLKQL